MTINSSKTSLKNLCAFLISIATVPDRIIWFLRGGFKKFLLRRGCFETLFVLDHLFKEAERKKLMLCGQF